MRIVVGQQCSTLEQKLHQLERGTLARVVHVLLVSRAQDADLASLDRFSNIVQEFGKLTDHVVGHVSIDFAGQFNETCLFTPFSGKPRQIERVDGDTVAAESRSWIK